MFYGFRNTYTQGITIYYPYVRHYGYGAMLGEEGPQVYVFPINVPDVRVNVMKVLYGVFLALMSYSTQWPIRWGS